jgi:hypothetical protein
VLEHVANLRRADLAGAAAAERLDGRQQGVFADNDGQREPHTVGILWKDGRDRWSAQARHAA